MRRIRSRSTAILVATVVLSVTPGALAAQLATPSGVRAPAIHLPRSRGPLADSTPSASRLPTRFGLALLGGLAGLFGGAALAANLELGVECDCDDPAIGYAVSGAVVGVALGAAFLAAVPPASPACAYASRLWRSVVGGALGVALGFVAPSDARIITVPLGGIAGAALGAESCAWQRH
jgi:hypothetical protein